MVRLGLIMIGVADLTAAILIARSGPDDTPLAVDSGSRSATTPARVHVTPPHPTPPPVIEAGDSTPKAAVVPSFDKHNLFADFQAALGSSDKRTVEAGLAAWRKCAGYVALGEGDIDDWLSFVMPANLSREERGRREQYARASAARCGGFARQGELLSQAQALSRNAVELGSVSEKLRLALVAYATGPAPAASLIAPSCEQVKAFLRGDAEGIRQITPAMRNAARERPSHFLNGVSEQARDIAINLALCDLDPDECGIHSNMVGSACVQRGKCDYLNEVEYWKSEVSAEVWNGAQAGRGKLVTAVTSGDCAALF
jgi:hypothetical protein